MRAPAVALVAFVSAVAGALLVLAIGSAAGLVSGSTETVVLEPAPRVEPEAPAEGATGVARPLQDGAFDAGRIYAERLDGVVTVYSQFRSGRGSTGGGQGSGFVVSSDGYILTNTHVVTDAGDGARGSSVAGADAVYVEFSDGDRVAAQIVGWDIFDDVAVIKVDPDDHGLAPLPLGDSATVRVGDPVAAIGSPFGEEGTLTVGVVSATHRSILALTSDYQLVDAIQTDAPINRGNSGGPLFNSAGRVIGINAQIRSTSGLAEGVGFAVPINSARRSMQQLIEDGRVAYAYVGVSTETMTPGLARRLGYRAERGALIVAVPAGPAQRAGLRGATRTVNYRGRDVRTGGDLVVAIDGRLVDSADELVRIVTGDLRPGQTATFTILRGARRIDVPVTLDERPADVPQQ